MFSLIMIKRFLTTNPLYLVDNNCFVCFVSLSSSLSDLVYLSFVLTKVVFIISEM